MHAQNLGVLVAPVRALQAKIRPGMDGNLTWTSMNIDAYLLRLHQGLAQFSELITGQSQSPVYHANVAAAGPPP